MILRSLVDNPAPASPPAELTDPLPHRPHPLPTGRPPLLPGLTSAIPIVHKPYDHYDKYLFHKNRTIPDGALDTFVTKNGGTT